MEATDNKDISLLDILEGLHYVMEYRIKGGKMKNLDSLLMKKLAQGLLHNTSHQTGTLMLQRPTEEAILSFKLFGDFLFEVHEFRCAVGEYSAFDLNSMLKIHRYCQSRSSPELKKSVVRILGFLSTQFTQFSDWKELVKEDEHNVVENLLKEFPDIFKLDVMPILSRELFPPSCI